MRIPEDISITGVDNTDLGATQTPGLTSIRTPIVEVGRAAAEQVIARLEGRDHEAFQTLPFELVNRGSTAGPAKNRSQGFPSERTALITASGFSRDRKWPATGMTRRSNAPLKCRAAFADCAGAPTPSHSP